MELRLLHVHGLGIPFQILCYIFYKVSGGYPRMNPSLFDCVVFATFTSAYVFANEQPADGSSGSSHKVNTSQDVTKMIYSTVFKQKRSAQVNAAESILNLKDYSKQYKMVELVLDKLFKSDLLHIVEQILKDARVKVTESALANILENTALFGDILLRLPDITHKVYSKSKEWDLLARWSISFCNETQVYDEMDSRLLDLVSCAWPVT
ncbi:Coiled-coil domain-containing protein 134 [Acropora cervicornis]|uniref:Coiled-coil domain-containing protein 134 n=1 Tax=Acropora cervicornis TaxID=6130 RepID=A0AAD9V6W2_ACRCE|nr:Coiled-coil domain-containing protein 134 [Acropora cervicornis]